MNTSYIRWQAGEPRESRVFDPLQEDNILIRDNRQCDLCEEHFKIGDLVQCLALGADDFYHREKLKQGRWIAALAIILHAECMTGKIDDR